MKKYATLLIVLGFSFAVNVSVMAGDTPCGSCSDGFVGISQGGCESYDTACKGICGDGTYCNCYASTGGSGC